MQDEMYMARALKLAARGRFTTHPNPNVGCVIVKDGEIVGEGFHYRAGEPHAEVHALRMAGEKARGATAYVTVAWQRPWPYAAMLRCADCRRRQPRGRRDAGSEPAGGGARFVSPAAGRH